MPKFYFDMVNSRGFLRDPEGQDCADADEARESALVSIRSILAEEVRAGRMDLRGRIEIRSDESAGFSIAFDDAVDVLTGPPPGEEAPEGPR